MKDVAFAIRTVLGKKLRLKRSILHLVGVQELRVSKQSQPLDRFCKPSLFLPRRRLWEVNTDLRWGRQNNSAKRNPDRD